MRPNDCDSREPRGATGPLCVGAVALAALLMSCRSPVYFDCQQDAECVLGGEPGMCFAGECGYSDDSCEGGYRYPSVARPTLAGTCVDTPSGSSSGPGVSTSATSTVSPTSGSTDASATTLSDDSSSSGEPPSACEVTELSGGDGFTCALLEGDVYCWGANDLLQLGSEGPGTASPRKVAALDTAEVVALGDVGDAHACAVTEEGAVWCWGEQTNNNVIGEGRPTVYPPTQVAVAGATIVGAGNNFSCAALANNVTCWGDTFWGQTGVMGGSGFNVTLVGTEVASLRQGNLHSCAIVQGSGEVVCWGADDDGQLGRNGDAPGRPLAEPDPQPPVGLPGDVQRLALGARFSCALQSGQTWCWGTDAGGELLGTGASAVPVRLDAVPDARDLVAGEQFACALTEEGSVVCWGLNSERQVDPLNDTSEGLSDVSAALASVTGVRLSPTKLGAGREHACSMGDHVLCWGRGEEGQLGDDAVTGSVAFVSLPGCARD